MKTSHLEALCSSITFKVLRQIYAYIVNFNQFIQQYFLSLLCQYTAMFQAVSAQDERDGTVPLLMQFIFSRETI